MSKAVYSLAMRQNPEIPDGFVAIDVGGGFMGVNGPLYARWTGSCVQMGFRVQARHVNPLSICHGGMMATFADMLIPCAAMYQAEMERRFLPTISLQLDYLGPSPLGAWVQGEAQVLRTTRNLLFGQGLVSADGQAVLRLSGVFKIGPIFERGTPGDPLGIRQPSAATPENHP